MKTFLFGFLALLVVLVGVALLIDKLQTGSTVRVTGRLKCVMQQRGKVAGLLFFVVLWFAYPFLAGLFTDDGERPVLMDVGVFQTILLATIRGLALYSFTKIFLKNEVAAVYRYFTRIGFKRDFYRLTPWQKQLLSALYVLGFLFLFAELTH